MGYVAFGDRGVPLHAFHTYSPQTRLAELPTNFAETWPQFLARLNRHWVTYGSCWLRSPTARVANVEHFVNMRRQPDFAAAVIRELPLGERVTISDFNRLSSIGTDQQRADCTYACRELHANTGGDWHAIANACIRDNLVWYPVRDSCGNEGWVSRRYL